MTPRTQLDLSSLRILDGGMATELERRGCDLSGPLWSAHILDSSPETIAQVHLDYLRAGADCISTVSYQISAMGYTELERSSEDAANALRQSVEIAESARIQYRRESGRPIFIAASLGPYGAALHNGAEFHGNYEITFEDLVKFHADRLAVMAETNADLIALETVPSLEEARAIAVALSQFPSIGAWIAFICMDGKHVAHGETLASCAALLDKIPQVVAIGINCTQPSLIAQLLGEIRPASQKPIVVYPNSGELWDAQHRCWYGPASVEGYAQQAKEWFAAGAQAVGGCCRITPEHIQAVQDMQK